METGRFIEVNESFCRIYGFSPAEVVWSHIYGTGLVGESWKNATRCFSHCLLTVRCATWNCPGLPATVETKMILFNAELVELGGKRCIISSIQDISERQQAEESVRFANRRLGFIAQMSAAILGNTTTAEVAQRLASQVREVFDVDACIIRVLEDDQLVLLGAAGVPRDPNWRRACRSSHWRKPS